MLKCSLAALLLAMLAVAPARADVIEPVTTTDCHKLALELAERAEDSSIDDAELERIEFLIDQMEAHCDAERLAEAWVEAQAIDRRIVPQN